MAGGIARDDEFDSERHTLRTHARLSQEFTALDEQLGVISFHGWPLPPARDTDTPTGVQSRAADRRADALLGLWT